MLGAGSWLAGRASKGSRRPAPTSGSRRRGSACRPTGDAGRTGNCVGWGTPCGGPCDDASARCCRGTVEDEAAAPAASYVGSWSSKSHVARLVKWRSQLRHKGRLSSHWSSFRVSYLFPIAPRALRKASKARTTRRTLTFRILQVRHPVLLFLCARRGIGRCCAPPAGPEACNPSVSICANGRSCTKTVIRRRENHCGGRRSQPLYSRHRVRVLRRMQESLPRICPSRLCKRGNASFQDTGENSHAALACELNDAATEEGQERF